MPRYGSTHSHTRTARRWSGSSRWSPTTPRRSSPPRPTTTTPSTICVRRGRGGPTDLPAHRANARTARHGGGGGTGHLDHRDPTRTRRVDDRTPRAPPGDVRGVRAVLSGGRRGGDRPRPPVGGPPRDQSSRTERATARDVLLAYREGYFESPRRINQEELAAELGVSGPAVSYRLRRGVAGLIRHVLLGDESGDPPDPDGIRDDSRKRG